MALSHLQLYYRAGKQEDIPLVKKLTTIGHADDSDIVISHASVSDHHLQIEFDSSGYRISDLYSSSGTYVNGIRLVAGTPQELPDGSVVRFGDLRMIVSLANPPTVVRPEPTVDPFLDQLLNAAIAASPTVVPVSAQLPAPATSTFQFTMLPATLTTEAGATASTAVAITNASAAMVDVALAVEGLPTAWVVVLPPSVAFGAGEQASVQIYITPPREPASRAGRQAFIVQLYDQSNGHVLSEVEGALDIAPFGGFELSLRQETPRAGQDSYQLSIQNTSNQQQAFRLRGRSAASALQFMLDPEYVSVAPGVIEQVRAQITPRVRRWIGKPETHAFAIDVIPNSDALAPKRVKGEFALQPPIPLWLVATLVPTLAVLVVALVVLLRNSAVESSTHNVGMVNSASEVPTALPRTRTALAWAAETAVAATTTLQAQVNPSGTAKQTPQPQGSATTPGTQPFSTTITLPTQQTRQPTQPSQVTPQGQPSQSTAAVPSSTTAPVVPSTPAQATTPNPAPDATKEPAATDEPVATSAPVTTRVPPSEPTNAPTNAPVLTNVPQPQPSDEPYPGPAPTSQTISFVSQPSGPVNGNEAAFAPLTLCFYTPDAEPVQEDWKAPDVCPKPEQGFRHWQPMITTEQGVTAGVPQAVAMIRFPSPVNNVTLHVQSAPQAYPAASFDFAITLFDADNHPISTINPRDNVDGDISTIQIDGRIDYLTIAHRDGVQFWIAQVTVNDTTH